MGVYSGAISLCRYRLVGAKPTSLKQVNQKIRTYQAKDVRIEGQDKEEHYGWVLPLGGEGYSEDRQVDDAWDMSDCQFGEGFFLRMRIERKKVSSELLQLMYRQRLNELAKDRDKPFSRKAQKALKEEVKASLLAKCLPAISYVDAYWQEDGQIMLFTTGKKNREFFENLFSKTFAKPLGGRLMRVDPPLLALSAKEWEHEGDTPVLKRIGSLLPMLFMDQGHIA